MVVHSCSSLIFIVVQHFLCEKAIIIYLFYFNGHLLSVALILMCVLMNFCGTYIQECRERSEQVQGQHSQVLSNSISNVRSWQQYMNSPQFPTRWTLGIISLFTFSHSGWCEVVSHWVLIYISKMRLKTFYVSKGHLVECLYGLSWCFAQNILNPNCCFYSFLPQLLDKVASNSHT